MPNLEQLSNLNLPPTLPSHPGHGNPSIYANARKKHLTRRLHTAIQLSVADDLANILTLSSWEEKQEAVDGLFEVIEERVREKEPILAKLPDFKERVEDGLEQVLRMVQSRVKGAKKGAAAATGDGSETSSSESDSSELAKVDFESSIDVMGVKKERDVPVFMDLLKVVNIDLSDDSTDDESSPKKSLSNFFTQSNQSGVPNLVYPLNVHHKDGVGRMVEEWQLAANKETKRIMMRDSMKQIAAKIVEATNGDGGAGDDKKGAARVFVTGKRGVGKVRNCLLIQDMFVFITIWMFILRFYHIFHCSRLLHLQGLLHQHVCLDTSLSTFLMEIDFASMVSTLNHAFLTRECIICPKLPRNFVNSC